MCSRHLIRPGDGTDKCRDLGSEASLETFSRRGIALDIPNNMDQNIVIERCRDENASKSSTKSCLVSIEGFVTYCHVSGLALPYTENDQTIRGRSMRGSIRSTHLPLCSLTGQN